VSKFGEVRWVTVELAVNVGLFVLRLVVEDIDWESNRLPPLTILDMLVKPAASIEDEEVGFRKVRRTEGMFSEELK
jgi:hypothetical protein